MLDTPAAVRAFLDSEDARLENPYKLRDMPQAVRRIVKALENTKGFPRLRRLRRLRRCLNCAVGDGAPGCRWARSPYIPDRVDEGYGLNVDAVMRIAEQCNCSSPWIVASVRSAKWPVRLSMTWM